MTVLGLALVVFTLTRLGLALYAGFERVPAALWPGVFLKGLWFDLAVLCVLAGPILLYKAVVPESWQAKLRPAHIWTSSVLLLFCAAAEATFWLEFSTRFNFIAVDYLLYTHEVIGNIRESYPIGWIIAGIALTAAAMTWAARRPIMFPLTPRRRLACAGLALALPALAVWLADVDQMRGSGNAWADELSGNGLATLVAAARRNELDYDRFYRTLPQAEADATLKAAGVERIPLTASLEDKSDPADDPIPFKRRPRNVVLVSVESLSANYLGAYGDPRKMTPNLDRLIKGGLEFERVFATGTRTVRGLEALSLGTPPVPGQAIVRRPHNEHLATLGTVFSRQGMESYFIYGGYGVFDNMNSYFAANGYKVLDRRDFPKESVGFANVWGVADEFLYDNALAALDKETRPFFAHIMTTSNHRPFTYPDGRVDVPSPGGREGAIKYTDYALGKFIADASKKPWFKDTLFVITADHCASVSGRTRLPVGDYHIPLLFYAPDLVKPGRYTDIVSQIDLAPTLVELLGKSGDDHFFGRAFFEPGRRPERAFISNYQELGYLRGDVLTVLEPKGRVESYRIDPKTYAATPAPVDQKDLREAIAYYQTAARAFKTGRLKY